MDINQFKQLPIMGILRGIDEEAINPLTQSIIVSGLKTVEITMNTTGAASLIKKMKEVANNKLTIGAGTVLTVDSAKEALDNGATFIVLPTSIEDVVKYCTKNNIPVFPVFPLSADPPGLFLRTPLLRPPAPEFLLLRYAPLPMSNARNYPLQAAL